MGPHGHVSVDVDPEVAGRRNWLHVSGVNADQTRRDLMLSTRRCAPENFSLGVIQLQSIGCHPSRNLIDTDKHFIAEVSRICGSAKPVDLSVVRVGMMNQLVALHQMQQVSGVQKEYDWPKQLPQSKYNMADAGHLENRYNVIFPRRMSDLDETRQPDAE